MLLGDAIKAALEKVGITEERVSRWAFRGGKCSCGNRRQRLNQLDAWARRVVAGKVERAKEYLDAIIGTDKDEQDKQNQTL